MSDENAVIWTGIVKVQRPIMETGGNYTMCLVYNLDRSILGHLEMNDEAIKLMFPDGELKTYWLAEQRRPGRLLLTEQLFSEQDW
jgi:hypothetical protein